MGGHPSRGWRNITIPKDIQSWDLDGHRSLRKRERATVEDTFENARPVAPSERSAEGR